MTEDIRRGRSGFTIGETLVAVLILLMVSSVVAAGIPAAKSAFEKVVIGANVEYMYAYYYYADYVFGGCSGISGITAPRSSSFVISVSMTPGATAFTSTPLRPTSRASALTAPMSPAFDAE